jgi:hypothetical protein
MRFIALRTVTIDGKIVLEGLASITQKASGIVASWLEFGQVTTNYLEPEKCDLLSFDEDEKEEIEEKFEMWGFDETVALIGVQLTAEASDNMESFSDEPTKS